MNGTFVRRLAGLATLLLLVPAYATVAEELPAPLQGGTDPLTLALGFESEAAVKTVLGKTGTLVPGRHGNGLTGLREWIPGKIGANLTTAAEGTVMGWLQLLSKAQAGYHQRWLKTSAEVSFLWGTDEPLLLGAKVLTQKPFRIETGDWHHWAYVWQGRARKLYIDGDLVIDGEAEELKQPPGFIVITEENGLQWVLDDLKICSVGLTQAQVQREMSAAVVRDFVKDVLPAPDGPVQAVTTEPVPDPAAVVVYDERQLVANPTLGLVHHGKAATQVPPNWSVTAGKGQVEPSASCLTIRNPGGEPVSVAAELRRGVVRAGAAYQVGLRYALQKQPGARVLLRFRNQIDQGSREVELAESAECRRHFFWLTAPEDYDVGIYYLEVLVRGGPAQMELRGAYAREATAAEAKQARLSRPAGLETRKTVRPDERWIEALPADLRFVAPVVVAQTSAGLANSAQPELRPPSGQTTAVDANGGRTSREPIVSERSSGTRFPNSLADHTPNTWRQAWTAGASGAGAVEFSLRNDGSSLLLERSPQELWATLVGAAQTAPPAPLRLVVTGPARPVPGGYGLDPLPARGTLGAALLFGIGAADTGAGSFVHGRTVKYLEEFGLFEPATEFLPFWGQKGLYALRTGADSANPPDFQTLWGGKEGAPLFAHTAPGVLVSGYRAGPKLLLVLVNTTDQELGKLGDLWVDLNRVFGIKGNSGAAVRNGQIAIRNPETGREFTANWNRNGGGFIGNWLFNLAIAPGDFSLVEIRQGK